MTKEDYKYLMDKKEYILEHMNNYAAMNTCVHCKYEGKACGILWNIITVRSILPEKDIINFYKIQDIKEKLK